MDAKPAVILVACLLRLCTSSSGAPAAGGGGCSLASIVVAPSPMGEWAHGQPVYAVTNRNTCRCPQSQVKVGCKEFNTTLSVGREKLEFVGGGLCLVNAGLPVLQGQDVTFSYASSTKFQFQPVSSTVAC